MVLDKHPATFQTIRSYKWPVSARSGVSQLAHQLPTMEELLQLLGAGGSGLLSGTLIGYGVKKLMKLVVILIVSELAVLKALEVTGIITQIRWERIHAALAGVNVGHYSTELVTSVGLLSGSSGLVAGMLLGFKHG